MNKRLLPQSVMVFSRRIQMWIRSLKPEPEWYLVFLLRLKPLHPPSMT